MPSEKSAEAIVVGATRRRAEPIENRELKSLAVLWQKPRKRASVEMQGPEARVISQVPIGVQKPDIKWSSTEPPDTEPYVRWCGRTAEANPSASYPIARQGAVTGWLKSNAHPARGSASRTARVSVARPNLKEAVGKTLA